MAIENKLGINDSLELAREEERLTKKRALELYDNKILANFEVGTFAGLKAIHGYLFQDIYLFADDPSKVSFYIFASLENIDDIVLHVPSFSAKKYKEVEHDFVRVEEGVLIPPSAYDDMEKTKVKVWQEFKKIEEFDPIDFM